MVVTGTSVVTTFGTQTFLQTVRVAGAGASQPPQLGAAEAHPQLGAGAAQPQLDAAGAAQFATATSSITVWYEPMSLVQVLVVVTGNERQT